MNRNIFEQQHALFRDSFRRFVAEDIVPHHEQWEQDGEVSRDVWKKAGEYGFLCMAVPEEYGGVGTNDFRFNAIVTEELARVGATGPGFPLHTDIVLPYLLRLGTEEQKKRWFPPMVQGDCIWAIAMTEPNTGSDLAAIQTTAAPNGDGYIVNGSKTFITNGIMNDAVIVAVKTAPKEQGSHEGLSLVVIERGMPGYERGRRLNKMGMHAQDTAELFFNDVHVPRENLLGQEGHGFYYLMENLAQERLILAVGAVASAEAAFEWTTRYCMERKAFGRPIGTFQNSRFKLAEMKTEIEIARVFVDRCLTEHNAGNISPVEACMAKWWTTDVQKRVVDQCLQLHGGYGYMLEYPIAKAYIDSRAATIFAGTNEIMKEVIGRSLGF
ncbi:MAG TPA: acyl-CoA dehydrogenase family protein [Pirellulales bacterium]|nr:acyl-CoA dehydrogenase family protein [Pirellulales bacterium]